MSKLIWPMDTMIVTTTEERAEMTKLFDAYFRGIEGQSPSALKNRILPLRLVSGRADCRYDFSARFDKNKGWLAQAKLKRGYLTMARGV